MNIKTAFTSLAAATLLSLPSTQAQAQVSTQELYTVRFRATCTPSDNPNGRSTRINDRDLIQECVGTNLSRRDIRRNYALVYNPGEDSLQVVNRSDGSPLCDVFIFEGGTNAVGGDQLTRFTFVFDPDESEAIGSAVITERALGNSQRARINGRLQFTRTVHTGTDTNGTETAAASTEEATVTTTTTTTTTTSSEEDEAGAGNETDTRVLTPTGTTATLTSGRFSQAATTSQNGTTNNANGSTGSQDDGNENDTDTGTDTGTGTDDGESNDDGSGAAGGFVQAEAAAVAATAGEVEICTGTFVVGRRFEPGVNGRGGSDNDDNDETPDTGEVGGSDGDDDSSNTNNVNTADSRFVEEATQNGLLEIELATLALQNSTNADVQAYAQRLIQDHTQANQVLAQLAGEKGLTIPTTLDQAGQNTVNRVANLNGRQFDRQFTTQAIATHRRAIQVFSNQASRGQNEDLRNFAQNNLPLLQEHLAEALQLQTGL